MGDEEGGADQGVVGAVVEEGIAVGGEELVGALIAGDEGQKEAQGSC